MPQGVKLIYIEEEEHARMGKAFAVVLKGVVCTECRAKGDRFGRGFEFELCSRHDNADLTIVSKQAVYAASMGEVVTYE